MELSFWWGLVVPPSVDALYCFLEEGGKCFSGVSLWFEVKDKCSSDFHKIVHAAALFVESAQVGQYHAAKDSWWMR